MSANELVNKLAQMDLDNSPYSDQEIKNMIEDLTKLAFHPDDPIPTSKYDEVLRRLVGQSTKSNIPQVPSYSPQNV